MKKRTSVVLLCILAALLGACRGTSGNASDPDNDDELPGGTKTWVRFLNANEFSVSVYTDRGRQQELTTAGAESESPAVEVEPNNNGAVFFPTFHIVIDDAAISYDAGEIVVRVDADKTRDAPNVVTIPSLYELGEDASGPISGAVYIKIQNSGYSSLVFRRGNAEEIPQGAGSAILNGGETGLYVINAPGPAAGFSVRKNTTVPVNFPPGLTEFKAGHLYSFRYDGNLLTLLAEKPLTIAQALSLSPPENIGARFLPITGGSISIHWDRAGTETSYRIYRAAGSPESFVFLAAAAGTSYTDRAVELDRVYYYRVSSVKNNIESEKSTNYCSVNTEVPALAVPGGLTAAALGKNSIRLDWNPSAEAEAYIVCRGSGPESITEVVVTTAAAFHVVTGLSPDTLYYFTVSAANAEGVSLPSAPVSAATLALAVPGGLTAVALDEGSIRLDWNPTAEADAYIIHRGGGPESITEAVIATAAVSHVVTGLSPAALYYFTVSASVNGEGVSLPSAPASAATFALPPIQPPAGLRAVYSGGSVTVSWDSVSGAAGYKVYRSGAAEGSYGYRGTVTASPYIDTEAGGPAVWYYRVSALRDGGEEGALSAYCSTASAGNAAELAAALSEIQAGGGGSYEIHLAGNFSSGPVTLTGGGFRNKTIALYGGGREISLSGTGSLFTVGADVSLELHNVTLKGHTGNNAPLVTVNQGGRLAVHEGAALTGNTYNTSVRDTGGGGVLVDGGTLEILGGEIAGNTVNGSVQSVIGGGILAKNNSILRMTGGAIRGNTCTAVSSVDTTAVGGGVILFDGSTFEMTGGVIEGNTASGRSTNMAGIAFGGGVVVGESLFRLTSGVIRNNTCIAVSANSWGRAMGGGVNAGDPLPGGQYGFIMEGGVINGNSCTSSINPNYESYHQGAYGGGVMSSLNSMLKTGGIIYGNEVTGNDTDGIPLKNTAQSLSNGLGGGHAVFRWDARRNTTAYEGNNMDSKVNGSAGGWN